MTDKLSRLARLLLVCTASLAFTAPAVAQWSFYEETSIAGKVSGSVRKGNIFKTRSGHIYEIVDYVFLYEYEYNPDVVVISDGHLYKLIIEGFEEPLLCTCLNCNQAGTDSSVATYQSKVNATIKAVQAALTALGFDPGVADGTLSPQTRSAIKKFRVVTGLTATDNLDAAILRSIAQALSKKYPENAAALTVALYLMQASENWPPPQPDQKSRVPGPVAPNVVESYITSNFDGLDHGNIYKLSNGQIWEQTEYWIWVWVWLNPKVLIWNDDGTYRMKVEGIDHPVMVRRIK